jgi:hypothetical protein
MQASQTEYSCHNLAVALIRQALELCDMLDYCDAACHLQMGLDMIEDPQWFMKIAEAQTAHS